MKTIILIVLQIFTFIFCLLGSFNIVVGQKLDSENKITKYFQNGDFTRLQFPTNYAQIGDIVINSGAEIIILGNIKDFWKYKDPLIVSKFKRNNITMIFSKPAFKLNLDNHTINTELSISEVLRKQWADGQIFDITRYSIIDPLFVKFLSQEKIYIITEILYAKKFEYKFTNLNGFTEAEKLVTEVKKELNNNASIENLISKISSNTDVAITFEGDFTFGIKLMQLKVFSNGKLEDRLFIPSQYIAEATIKKCKCRDCRTGCNCCPLQRMNAQLTSLISCSDK